MTKQATRETAFAAVFFAVVLVDYLISWFQEFILNQLFLFF
jgi:hypothetical protein